MTASRCWVGLLFCLLLGLSGCSSVHVDVNRDFSWNHLTTLALDTPAADRWNLEPLIAAELRQQGFAVVPPDTPGIDSLVRFRTGEKQDLDAEGNLSQRLDSVHLQFLDPQTGNRQAVIDYFYPTTDSSHTVAEGIQEALSGLRRTQTATRNTSAHPEPDPQPQASTSTTGTSPPAAAAQQPAPQTDDTRPDAVQSDPQPAEAPEVTSVNDQNPEKAAREEPQPQTRSPWIPRFQSWGFDNWGDDEDTNLNY